MSAAKDISNRIVAAIEAAPDVAAMREAWAPVTRVDSLNNVKNGMVGTYFDGRVLVTVADDGSVYNVDAAADFTYRTSLVVQAMRRANGEFDHSTRWTPEQ